MPDFAIYRRTRDSRFHSKAVTLEASNLDEVIHQLNAGIAGHFDVEEGDVLLVRRVDAGLADTINTVQVHAPQPRFSRV